MTEIATTVPREVPRRTARRLILRITAALAAAAVVAYVMLPWWLPADWLAGHPVPASTPHLRVDLRITGSKRRKEEWNEPARTARNWW
jgi:hypothetical protein